MKQILILVLSILSITINARNIEVCSDCKITTLQDAIAQSEEGDVIILKDKTYSIPNIIIDKSISITGINYPNIIAVDGGEIFTITGKDVTISGLVFSGVTTNYLKENSAIRIKKTSGFKILDNRFEDCFFAIYIEKGRRGIISRNHMTGNAQREADSGNGIHAWYSEDLEIHNNFIQGHRDGIYFEFVNDSYISGNTSFDNLRYGLHFMFSNDDQYCHNTFKSNGVGVAVMFSRRIEMIENNFHKNWGTAAYGLLLKEIFDGDIKDNSFKENTIGIFVEGSNRIVYERNNFVRNGWAIKFSGGCEKNQIINNNFIHNSLDMLVSTKLSENIVHGNYWSAYAGYDLDRDGYGDIPYYPVKLYSYILNEVPESVVLMRSLFVDIVNFAEKISPVFTPKDVYDYAPKMLEIS